MGFFSNLFRRSSPNTPPRDLRDYLTEIDDALIMTFETRNTASFREYCEPAFSHILPDLITENKGRMFGVSKYRKRQWTILKDSPNELVVRKELGHENLRISKSVYLAVGEEVTETWTLKRHPNNKLKLKSVAACYMN